MKKETKEKIKPKKHTVQNKLKKVLHPNNAKPISLESNTGDAKVVKRHIQKINQNKNVRKNSSNTQNINQKKNIQKKIDIDNLQNKKSTNYTTGELDYLNFSKIDICKPNSSFEEDIFDPNHLTFFEKKKITSNRYNNIDSSLDTIKTDKNSNAPYIQPSQENKLKTPSTICNYYENSEYTASIKKNIKPQNEDNKSQLRINLSQLYENSIKNKTQKIINWRLKDSIKITKNKSSSLNSKENLLNIPNDINNKSKINTNNINSNTNKNLIKTEKIPFKNNLMENYLNNKITKQRKGSFNMSSSKKNSFYNKMNINKDSLIKNLSKNHNSSTQNIHNKNNSNNNTHNNVIIPNQKFSNSKIQVNKNKSNNTTNGITNNGIYYINLSKNSNMNYSNHKKINYNKKGKQGQQKPIMLCYDQIKYDSYFVTPKNFTKLTKGKVSNSNKTTKEINNNNNVSIGCCQNNRVNNISNNNTNKTFNNNLFNDNYNIIIKNYFQNKNKSFNNKINTKNNINKNNSIKKNNNNNNTNKNQTNLLSHIKSFSYLMGRKNTANKYRNISNKKMSSGTKESSGILYDLLTNNKEKINSPPKTKKVNILKISKTLTEQNILNRMQTTPKYYKIPKGGNEYTTISKKKYDNTNSNTNTNTNKKYNNDYNMFINNLFKHKTQSDVKTNKYFINSNNSKYTNGKENTNNNYYDMDKNVKQKLLDRMNNATKNNWHYILRGNNNNESTKVLLKNLSEIMQTPDKEEYLKNNTIISNESEGEIDKENESKNVLDNRGKPINRFIVDLGEYDENNLNTNNEY